MRVFLILSFFYCFILPMIVPPGEACGLFVPEVQSPNQRKPLASPTELDRVSSEVLAAKVGTMSAQRDLQGGEKQVEEKGWIKRHPVLFGTFVGFFVGTILGQATAHEDLTQGGVVLIYGSIGAGVGALVGKVASGF